MAQQTFAQRLKELREQAGLSQAELAEKADMHRFGIAKLERGDREPAWATVQKIARALGVSCVAFEDTVATPEPETPPPPKPRGRPKKSPPPAPAPEQPKGKRRKGGPSAN